MPYTLSPKPAPGALINWELAPASLVGCSPLIQGEDSVTTLEYVTRQPSGNATTFLPVGSHQTTWQSWGVNMDGRNGGSAQDVKMSVAADATMDQHRRTIAWAQRVNVQTPTLIQTNAETDQLGQFSIQAPEVLFASNRVISVNFGLRIDATTAYPGATFLDGTSPTSFVGEWHALMVSWSDGLGVDARTGIAIWDNGVLIASQATQINGLSPGPQNIRLGFSLDSPNADFEYWYEFNEFIPAGNTLAQALFNDPYYFFKPTVRRRAGAPFWRTLSAWRHRRRGVPTGVDVGSSGPTRPFLLYHPDTREVEVVDRYSPKGGRSRGRGRWIR